MLLPDLFCKIDKLWNLDNSDRCYINGEEGVRQRVIKMWINCQEVKIVIEIIYFDKNNVFDEYIKSTWSLRVLRIIWILKVA